MAKVPESQIKQTDTIRWVRPLGFSLDLSLILSYMLLSLTAIAIPVVKFSSEGYKTLERFLAKNQHTQRKSLNFENWISMGLRSFQKSEF